MDHDSTLGKRGKFCSSLANSGTNNSRKSGTTNTGRLTQNRRGHVQRVQIFENAPSRKSALRVLLRVLRASVVRFDFAVNRSGRAPTFRNRSRRCLREDEGPSRAPPSCDGGYATLTKACIIRRDELPRVQFPEQTFPHRRRRCLAGPRRSPQTVVVVRVPATTFVE